ncbi:hypothetical protein [Deinococcus navajonensis]|uniref:Uncharacterized protein n=1 Tax=Deinococcus navajonensis TaxID=309884 RepID=A0ABV8XIF7_9DEIO
MTRPQPKVTVTRTPDPARRKRLDALIDQLIANTPKPSDTPAKKAG